MAVSARVTDYPKRMLPILTREQMRAFDQHAITQCDVPGIILMENAGRGAAAVLRQHYSLGRAPMVIVCGGGNNGGDGFVVARQLLSAGVPLAVFTLVAPEGLAGDALVNYRALCGVGCVPILLKGDLSPLLHALAEACVVVDALLGTGISRAVSGIWWEVITALNHAAVPVVALDIPSGLDANTGAVLGVAVRATRTLTFGAYKRGLLQGAAREHVGAIEVIDLGVPTADIVKSVGATASIMTRACLIAALQPRARATHKYRAGNVLVLGGSPGKTGAALLCARAALRAGAGM
ncbi:MAG TPA: NAD(P)H-hydrate epimerase, partial [Sorangium sp.]|nr:NAD(P)H-hydrate epimerase [Sorangium sp.]